MDAIASVIAADEERADQGGDNKAMLGRSPQEVTGEGGALHGLEFLLQEAEVADHGGKDVDEEGGDMKGAESGEEGREGGGQRQDFEHGQGERGFGGNAP